MDRVFLDANVLFSAAWRREAGLARFWDLKNVRLLTSGYAAEEARRNLPGEDRQARLDALLSRTELVTDAAPGTVTNEELLPEKDRPILQAAVQARATHLITGDVTHFGPFFGRRLHGVLVLPPADYLRSKLTDT